MLTIKFLLSKNVVEKIETFFAQLQLATYVFFSVHAAHSTALLKLHCSLLF